ncbi:MAG TPA: membrane dipeptidase [Aggregatilineaceae bacterium]|nr:membrane dipeptidase [Aggregatilineaceae bacterium]
MNNTSPPKWMELHYAATVVDFHAHPALKAVLFHRNLTRRYRPLTAFFWPPNVETNFPALERGGVDVLLSAIYAPEKPILTDLPLLKVLRYAPWPFIRRTWNELFQRTYFEATVGLLDDLEGRIDAYNRRAKPGARQRHVELAHSVDDLDRMVSQGSRGPIAFIHTIEGGHSLQGETGSADEVLRNLDALFERGVAALTLAHFYPNRLVSPVFPYPEYLLPLISQKHIDRLWTEHDLSHGLTSIGEQVVERMLELGMIIDVSHATPPARRRVYEIAGLSNKQGAVVATHVGAYEINPSPYNLEDWEIRWMTDHGGVVGVIFMNYWLMANATNLGVNFVSRTIEHFVQAGGGTTDHVVIGSDFDGFTDTPDDLKNASEMPRLTQRLMSELKSTGQRKYTDEDVEKILGKNALRVLRDGWGRKHNPA